MEEATVETLLGSLPPHCRIVTVIDRHLASFAWIGAVRGHHATVLGVGRFGQTSMLSGMYRPHGIDAGLSRHWLPTGQFVTCALPGEGDED